MILITRPKEDAYETAKILTKMGFESLVDPMLEIKVCEGDCLSEYPKAVLFTSMNGVRFCPENIIAFQPAVYTVGDSTARAAKNKGFKSVISAKGGVEDLYRLILEKIKAENGLMIHFSGEITTGNLAERLKQKGYQVQQIKIYASKAAQSLSQHTIKALEQGLLTSVLFFSPRTANIFKNIVTTSRMTHFLKNLSALCISHETAKLLKGQGWKSIQVASQPNQNELLRLLELNKR